MKKLKKVLKKSTDDTEILRAVGLALIGIGEEIDDAVEDKKVTWLEYLGIGMKAKDFIILLKHRDKIWNAMRGTKQQVMVDLVRDELDINNERLELQIKAGWNALIGLFKFSLTFAKDK